jgi:hypothetical protein
VAKHPELEERMRKHPEEVMGEFLRDRLEGDD